MLPEQGWDFAGKKALDGLRVKHFASRGKAPWFWVSSPGLAKTSQAPKKFR
jgi:hypothetical protein